jgi:hypothetical protein
MMIMGCNNTCSFWLMYCRMTALNVPAKELDVLKQDMKHMQKQERDGTASGGTVELLTQYVAQRRELLQQGQYP